MCINDKIGIGVDAIRVIENKYYVGKKTKMDIAQQSVSNVGINNMLLFSNVIREYHDLQSNATMLYFFPWKSMWKMEEVRGKVLQCG